MTAAAPNPGADRSGMAWPQVLTFVFGVVYLLVGIVGFFITGFDNFASNEQHEQLLWFMINPLHNLLHIVIGVAGLVLARTLPGARGFGWLLAAGYGALFVYGLFAVDAEWDFLNINWGDNWLHLVTAVVGLVIALGPVRTAVSRSPA